MKKLPCIGASLLLTTVLCGMAAAASPPASEQAFLSAVDQASAAFDAAPNEMAQGATRPRRKTAICQILSRRVVEGWTGTVETLSSTSDGKGILLLRLSPHVTTGTTNNGFSDALGTMKTLIDPESSLFQTASALKSGQEVVFSGRFLSSPTDCVEEGSMTQSGSMHDPEFRFQFNKVAPAA